jgi:hypothetical protein
MLKEERIQAVLKIKAWLDDGEIINLLTWLTRSKSSQSISICSGSQIRIWQTICSYPQEKKNKNLTKHF